MYYQVSLDDEIRYVSSAVDYYLSWAEELRSTTFEWELVHQYYRGLLDPAKVAAIQFRALFFAMRLEPILAYIKEFKQTHKRPPYILDLGAGFGLESLFLCLQGSKVHGLDGWQPMVEHARWRQDLYESKHNISLDLRYDYENLFKFEPAEQYDEPIEEAFRCVAALIKPGGHFFLSDENGYSPVQQLAVQKKIGWIRPRKYLRIDPDTGESFMYGNENIRPTFLWSRYMGEAGLKLNTVKYCRFLPPLNWPLQRLIKFERVMRNVPLIAQLGAIGFLIDAHKS
jgi:2-polyprenyl-3-methyl-5-hydroxy-6-metoxy-1,4-benzoquinol methylase